MHQNKQAYGERYDCRADSGHGGVIGRDSDAPRVLGRDSDAQRGESGEMSPDNHLSVLVFQSKCNATEWYAS